MICVHSKAQPKVVLEKLGVEPVTTGLHMHRAYSLHHIGESTKFFVAFPWVETSTGPGGFIICVFII